MMTQAGIYGEIYFVVIFPLEYGVSLDWRCSLSTIYQILRDGAYGIIPRRGDKRFAN